MEVGLSLGSNQGNRLKHLQQAKALILGQPGIILAAQSPVYETEPVDVPAEFEELKFLNALLIVKTLLPLPQLLTMFQFLEQKIGRVPDTQRHAPRPIDIDIIYADGLQIQEEYLVIPHPEWAQRRFVVQPLADVRPDMVLPGQALSTTQALAQLKDPHKVETPVDPLVTDKKEIPMSAPEKKWTATRITALKGQQKLACLTAYDYGTARLMDEAGLPLLLVGDSLAMTVLGYANTLPVTMEAMLHHTAAVARGVHWALVVADMPFMSYQVSTSQALENAGRFIKEAGADAVKIEGGAFRAPTVQALVAAGIPVLAHIGITPQSLRAMGGYKVQGKEPRQADALLQDARGLAAAGAFAIVLEGLPAALGGSITAAISIPTISIGAGPHCDGQILVVHDLLGLFEGFTPKFVKRYANLGADMKTAFAAYKADVEQGAYPGPEHCY